MPKQVYTWGKVRAGDIISFRYKGKAARISSSATLLVLNPKMPMTKKDGTDTFHLIGLKLEEQGTIPLIRNQPLLSELLEQVGEIQLVDTRSGIYRVEIRGAGSRGATKRTYENIKRKLDTFSVYRTYNYKEARKSAVFLEPIVISKDLREILREVGISKAVDLDKVKEDAIRKAAELKLRLDKIK